MKYESLYETMKKNLCKADIIKSYVQIANDKTIVS